MRVDEEYALVSSPLCSPMQPALWQTWACSWCKELPEVPARGRRFFVNSVSEELRDITLFHELLNKKKAAFQLKVGKPIPPASLDIDAARATAGLKTFTERVLPDQPDADFA